jgi:LPS export ABC transporter protein LptC
MRRWRWLLALALVGLVVAGAYFAGISQQARTDSGKPNEADSAAYDYEANTVTVRQMDEEGRLQYEVQAEHVAQLPRDGAVMASKLTMHYDPPGSHAKDESNRWRLTADSAQLPENSDVVALKGNVIVRGRPSPTAAPMTFNADDLDYNLKSQVVTTPGPFRFTWQGSRFSGTGLKANIKQGTIDSVESGTDGQILP